MPIRFHCPNCNQRLSVGSRKAGTSATCPKCAETLCVPASDSHVGVPEPTSEEKSDPQAGDSAISIAATTNAEPGYGEALFQEFVVYDDEPLASGDVEVVAPSAPAEDVDYGKLAIPRWILFSQGLLLGVVGLVCFVFGLMIGARSAPETVAAETSPCVITGEISFRAGVRTPDADAVIIIVPQESRPEEKIAASRLSPLEPEPLRNDPRLAAIRALGGDYARADEAGGYRLRVPDKGNYFLLIISHGKRQSESAAFDAIAAAQMGRFFTPTLEMLGDQAYHWQPRTIRADTTINHDFD